MTPEQLAATIAAQDARIAASRPSRKRLPKMPKLLRTGSPDQVYDLVSGKPVKMLGRAAVEKRLRTALRSLRPDGGLELSRALDRAELEDLPQTHPLVERCAEALRAWEAEH